jgi:hypothetical protein
MKANLPPAPPSYEAGFFLRAFARIDQIFDICVTRQAAVEGVLLQAPDGGVWKVTVDNSGNLITTSVPLGQTGAPTY